MHDKAIEERLRSTLRSEANSLPLTVTTDELERRLVLRRRERTNRRFGLIAAGVAAIAVGTAFTIAIGPFRGPSVVATPQPSAVPSARLPSPQPTSGPPLRVAAPLGAIDEAVLVRAIGGGGRRPDSYEVSLFDPVAETSEVVATLPGSTLPEDGWLDGGEGPPAVSRTGYLAIPFTRGPNEDDRYPAIAIVDVRAPTHDPWIIDRYGDPAWGPAEQLVARTSAVSEAHVAWVPTGEDRTERIPGGLDFAGWSTDEDARLVGTREESWGSVDFNGRFTATTDLPAVYQRTGLERPAGVDVHTLGMGCDSSGGEPTGGCILGEWASRDEPPIRRWHTEGEGALRADHSWAVDGRGVLLLLTSGLADNRIPVELVYADTPEHQTTVAGVEVPDWVLPAILGVSAEPTAGRPTVTAIGDSDGRVVAFLLDDGLVRTLDGTAWFAGWADDPAPYDPD